LAKDVSGQPLGPIFDGHETSVTNYQHMHGKSEKSEILIFTAVEACGVE
jgi:hypothetical protein